MDAKTKITSTEAKTTVYKWILPLINPDISKDELVAGYKRWTEISDYEKVLGVGGYQAHFLTVQYFTDGYPTEKRPDAHILDVGAGTGLVARGLRGHGFRHIDALDPCENMLNQARKDGLYDNYFCDFLSEKQLPMESNTYDGATAAGCFCPGHIQPYGLYELLRLVKPAGTIVIVTRIEYLETCPEYPEKLERVMERLEMEGKWKKIERDVGDRFFLDKEAVCYKYKVLADSAT